MKQEITANWKSREGPSFRRWKTDLAKWAESEGTVWLQLAQRLNNEKALETARAWEALVQSLKEQELTAEAAPS